MAEKHHDRSRSGSAGAVQGEEQPLLIDAGQGRPRRLTHDDFTAVLDFVLARLPKLHAPALAPGMDPTVEITPPLRLAPE